VYWEASGVGIVLNTQFIGATSVKSQLQHNAWFDQLESVKMCPNLLGQLKTEQADWPAAHLL
jgi:hypothetical protein